MECPACHAEWRLAESLPCSVRGRHVYLRCPNAGCEREAIAEFPHDPVAGPKLLTMSAARRVGHGIVLRQRSAGLIVATVLASGSLAFGAFLVLWQWLAPSPGGNSWLAYVALFAVGLLGALMIVAVFAVIVMIGAERWLQTLPRADLVFGRTPELYRE